MTAFIARIPAEAVPTFNAMEIRTVAANEADMRHVVWCMLGRRASNEAVIEQVTLESRQQQGAWQGLRCDICGTVFDGFHVLNAEGDRCCPLCCREQSGSGRTQGPPA